MLRVYASVVSKTMPTKGAIFGSFGVCTLSCFVVIFSLLFSYFCCVVAIFFSFFFFFVELALTKFTFSFFISLPPLTEGRTIACALRAKTVG